MDSDNVAFTVGLTIAVCIFGIIIAIFAFILYRTSKKKKEALEKRAFELRK